MPSPDQILADKRARIAGLEASLAAERAELRGMEVMAAVFAPLTASPVKPSAVIGLGRVMATASILPSPVSENASAPKGRQPGAISMRWRAVLWRLDELGGNFFPSDVVRVVQELEGREVRQADAKRHMEAYAVLGFVEAEFGRYNVTNEFREKFVKTNGSNENGAPAGEAEGAPEAEGIAVPSYLPSNEELLG